MFDVDGTKSLDSNAIEFQEKGINFIGRTFENNGIQGKISEQNFKPNEPFTITATVTGNYKYVKYQKEPYYCSQNINKLTPNKIIKKWNEKIAYYFIASIQKFVSLYDGQQGGYRLDVIKNHKIQLPIKNSQPDFDFMENFIAELEAERIAELEAERIAELEAYLSVSGLKDYELTDEEERVLNDFENCEFKEYNLVEIFDVKNTKNILSKDIIENSGKIPYLSAGLENNSVSSYISYKEEFLDKGNCIFIGGKTFVVSYQEKNFYSNDSHNLALYLKNENKNKLIQIYLAVCVNKSLKHKYSWGDSVSNKKIQKDIISLSTKNSIPDYSTMETFISAIQKLVIKDVVLYSEKKLNATKKVVNT